MSSSVEIYRTQSLQDYVACSLGHYTTLLQWPTASVCSMKRVVSGLPIMAVYIFFDPFLLMEHYNNLMCKLFIWRPRPRRFHDIPLFLSAKLYRVRLWYVPGTYRYVFGTYRY